MQWRKETTPIGGGDRIGYRLVTEDGARIALFFPSHDHDSMWYVAFGSQASRYLPMAEWPIEKLQALLTVEARLEGFK